MIADVAEVERMFEDAIRDYKQGDETSPKSILLGSSETHGDTGGASGISSGITYAGWWIVFSYYTSISFRNHRTFCNYCIYNNISAFVLLSESVLVSSSHIPNLSKNLICLLALFFLLQNVHCIDQIS